MTTFQKKIYKNKEEIAVAAAELFVEEAKKNIAKRGKFIVSLSGGSTPKTLYALLATAKYSDRIDWQKVYFFWGDERAVAPDHKDSNYRMVKEALLDHVNIPSSNVFRIKGELPPAAAVNDYQEVLRNFFVNKPVVFDLCFLGMGDDGHTASIFPGTKAVSIKRKRVQNVYVKKLEAHRITVTAPVINRSRLIVFLVAGANKAAALKEVFYGNFEPNVYPSQLIRAATGEVFWYLDKDLGAV